MIMILLAATTFALPLLVPKGPGNTAPVDVFAALFIAIVIGRAIISRRRRLVTPMAGPLLLIAMVSAIAVVFSVAPGTGLLNLLIEAYLVALLWTVCTELRQRPDRMAVITSVWVVASVFWAFLLIGTQWNLLPGRIAHLLVASDSSSRAAAAAHNPNLAASFLVTSMFVVLASPWPRSKLIKGGILVWLFIAVTISGSNGALLGIAAGVAFLIAMRVIRRSSSLGKVLVGVTAAIAAGVAIFAVVASNPTINQGTANSVATTSKSSGVFKDNLGRLNYSVAARLNLWSSALKGGFDHSAIGVGVGEAQTIQVDNSNLGQSLHNDVLAFLLERGIIGLAALILLVAVLMRMSFRLARVGPARINGRVWHLQALGAGVVANLGISLTHESYHFRHVWMLLALVWVATDLVAAPAAQRVTAPARAWARQAAMPLRGVRVPA
jgi:O-antigen ligase